MLIFTFDLNAQTDFNKITRCYKYVYKKYEVVVLPREQMCHVKLLRIVNEVKGKV
jgi:hypothetical protein